MIIIIIIIMLIFILKCRLDKEKSYFNMGSKSRARTEKKENIKKKGERKTDTRSRITHTVEYIIINSV